jgi:hypothetical protein
MEAVAKPQAAVSFFCPERQSVKTRTKVLPWPPDHALRERLSVLRDPQSQRDGRASVSNAVEMKGKRAAHFACTRAALGTNRRSLGGGGGYADSWKQTQSGLRSS